MERRDKDNLKIELVFPEIFINYTVRKIEKIMATLQELTAKVDYLQVALDNEQAQVADLLAANTAAVAALEVEVARLNDLIANGATPDQLQVVADKIDGIKGDLEATV